MNVIIFECKKCGNCCRNLLESYTDVTKGLVLTIKETKLFPSEMISPKIAIGKRKPKIIINYQLNVNDCPHINERNECKIYDKRPLMCKAFPYESGSFSVKCSIFADLKVGILCNAIFSVTEIEASEKLNKHTWNRLQRYFKKGMKSWEYDLATKKWILRLSSEKLSERLRIKQTSM